MIYDQIQIKPVSPGCPPVDIINHVDMQYEGLSDDNSKVLFASTKGVITSNAVYSCSFKGILRGSQCLKVDSKVLPGLKQIIARPDYIYTVARKDKDQLQLSLINPLTMLASEQYTIEDQSRCELTEAAAVV